MNAREQCILELLEVHGEQYGLDLVKRSDGRLKRGTVYVYLQHLEEQELVAHRDGPPEPRLSALRKLYRITPKGARARRESLAEYLASALRLAW